MQNEIVTTPGELAGMPGIPRHVRDWAFKRGERVCWLTLTDTGVNCCLRSGAMSLEFDTTDSRRAVSVTRRKGASPRCAANLPNSAATSPPAMTATKNGACVANTQS